MKLKALLLTLLALPLMVLAGVNPKNGSFYITYTDLSLKKNGHELAITRTYNSKSIEVGWFGFGWGSLYESRLIAMPDGSAVIKETGSGRNTFYRTKDENAIKAGVQRIVEVATQKENLTPAAAEQLARQLLGDEELRLRKVLSHSIHAELPSGTALNDDCGAATLKRVAEGYRRVDCNRFGDSESATDTFDLKGRLTQHVLDDGYAITLRYTDSGTTEIRDTQGQSITLAWTPEGHVSSATANDKWVKYAYVAQNLARNEIESGNTYRYSYDNNHNMTRIDYVDNSSMFISYSPSVNGAADSVTDRHGLQQTFVYRTDPANPNHYWTKRTTIATDGFAHSQEFEYEDRTSPTGVTQPTRWAVADESRTVETKFDDTGRVIRQNHSQSGGTEYIYHPHMRKIIVVLTKNLATTFHYDAQGQLSNVSDTDGLNIELDYAKTTLVQRMVEFNPADQTRREFKFKYNTAERLTEITLVGTGKVNVHYDSQGNPSITKTARGESMAQQITVAFQTLKNVIAVTGAKF